MHVFRISAIVVLAVLPAPAHQITSQQPPARDCAISGVVKDTTTGQPIADAVVGLGAIGPRGFATATQRQLTDARGRFVFTELAPGDYQIQASKSGYGGVGDFTQRQSGIHLIAGQWFSAADVQLTHPSSISGTVFDERGEPVIGVYVRLLTRVHIAGADHLAAGIMTLTDDRGMYRVGQLRPGRYVAVVPSVQSSMPANTPLTTLLNASPQNLDRMRRADGTFADRPLIDAGPDTRLGVGGYPVPPPPVNGSRMGYPIAFSGGGSIGSSAGVVLEAGMDRTGVDVRLEPVPVSRISGVVQGPAEAVANLSLRLLPEGMEELGAGSEAATALVGPNGSFTFANVPAGNYTIDAPVMLNEYTAGPLDIVSVAQIPYSPGGQPRSISLNGLQGFDGIGFSAGYFTSRSYWARMSIAVGAQDVSNVVVTMRPVMTMRGRAVFDADAAFPSPPASARFILQTANGNPSNTDLDSGNPSGDQFTIPGITPGQYLLHSTTFGWIVKSVVVSGREHVNTPIDAATEDLSSVVVTFTNAAQSINGAVTKGNGEPGSESAVIVFPFEPEQWTNFSANPTRIKVAATVTDGTFRMPTLPGGDYYAVAVPVSRINAWTESGFFEKARRVATHVSLGWGETKTVTLKVADLR